MVGGQQTSDADFSSIACILEDGVYAHPNTQTFCIVSLNFPNQVFQYWEPFTLIHGSSCYTVWQQVIQH